MRSIRKSRSVLHHCYSAWKKRGNRLSQGKRDEIEQILRQLDSAVQGGNREEADRYATMAEERVHEHLAAGFFDSGKELFIALVFALIVATVLRQMWFEFYEIPTGSMRPTFKEQDHLLVTKTSFGINIPLQANQFYFDPELVKRTGIVIFTGENLDLPDTDAYYFGVFPSKKRYIKRLIGKPNDTLWFYGGQVYGVDEAGKEVTVWRDAEYMANLEYIPISRFEGRTSSTPSLGANGGHEVYIRHFNLPVARITFTPEGGSFPQLYYNGKWITEGDIHYYDFFGMSNIGQVRMLAKEQMPVAKRGEANYYLEIRHHPVLQGATLLQNAYGSVFPLLKTQETYLPLSDKAIEELRKGLYTARFVVKDELATRYNVIQQEPGRDSPKLDGVPDGTYEFYYGQGYQIGFMGKASPLAEDHPLNDPKHFQKLFNTGIELSDSFTTGGTVYFLPSRYVYYRNGDLYVMGRKIMGAEESLLKEFVAGEQAKAGGGDYIPFVDSGVPKLDGEWKEKVGTMALRIPEGNYVAMGDNHAMSGDSRYFGFVPQQNLLGSPLVKIWPELGVPRQPGVCWFALPTVVVWGTMVVVIVGLVVYFGKKRRRAIFS